MRSLAALIPIALVFGCFGPATPAETVSSEPGFCPDGLIDGGEECDDGVSNSDTLPNACRSDCTLPFCGDGVVDSGEECDGSEDCDSSCHFLPSCGDGELSAGEECDHDGPDCTELCTFAVICGDGIVGDGEECDDGNTLDGDGCDGTCSEEPPVCGDGVREEPEECDDGNQNPGDGCTEVCQSARCGDGRVHVGVEECDEGARNGSERADCTELCSFPRCGDGTTDPDERCDNGDARSAECLFCGGPATSVSLVNLLADGRDLSLVDSAIVGPVAGPVERWNAVIAQPSPAGGDIVDLILSDGTFFEGVMTENGMGPEDHYTFVVYGEESDPRITVIRENRNRPPEGEVRIRVMRAIPGADFLVSLQETPVELGPEYLFFYSSFGELGLDFTRPPGPLDVTMTVHGDEANEYFHFALGETEVGADNSIYVTGTRDTPVLIRTTTLGQVIVAEGARVDLGE